ncbi:hypothetical protein [Nocardia brasiliensis]|uniref:hypothetical protein n=1 Tax=Nocardia brasiliensis TaxID=37326 RepID=UPI00367177A6
MTGPPPALRVRDLPAEQAKILGRIHELASQARYLGRIAHNGYLGAVQDNDEFIRLREVDRDRKLTEARAYGNGIPPSWVEHARQLGHTGQDWTPEQRLPPAHTPPRRRTASRVVDDTRQMTEMAAVHAVREHLLAATTGSPALDPAAAHQFSRNLEALWTRAARTADAVGIPGRDREEIFTVSDEEFRDRVSDFLRYSPGDLDMVWRRHAAESIASSVRRSLKNLRRANAGNDITTPDPAARQPPDPASLIERAHHVLHTLLSEQLDTGADIDAAIIDATLDDTVHPEQSVAGAESGEAADTVFSDCGPDP